jgi:hypothetical protein
MITVQKVKSGLRMWDVVCNGVQIVRFDTKWEAEAKAEELKARFV